MPCEIFFLYIAKEKCESVSNHSEKYPSSLFIHYVPYLEVWWLPWGYGGIPWWLGLKRLPAMWEARVLSLGREDPLEKEMATHSSTLAWRIPWTESLVGYSPRGPKAWDTTERLHFHFHHRLKNDLWRSPYFFLFLAVSSSYFLHPCGAVFLPLTPFSESVASTPSLRWWWLRLGRADSGSHACSAVTGWVTKVSLSLMRQQFIFHPQETLHTPTSIWVLPKRSASSLHRLTLPLSSASDHPTVWDPTDSPTPLPPLSGFCPLPLVLSCPSGSDMPITSTRKPPGWTQSWLPLLSVACAIFPILVLMTLYGHCLFVCFSSLGHTIFQGGRGPLHLVIPLFVTEPLHRVTE